MQEPEASIPRQPRIVGTSGTNLEALARARSQVDEAVEQHRARAQEIARLAMRPITEAAQNAIRRQTPALNFDAWSRQVLTTFAANSPVVEAAERLHSARQDIIRNAVAAAGLDRMMTAQADAIRNAAKSAGLDRAEATQPEIVRNAVKAAGLDRLIAREMLAATSPLRRMLEQMEQTESLRFGFAADQIAFARRVAEATPPEVVDEVVQGADALEEDGDVSPGITQWLSEQAETLAGKDEEVVFLMTYAILFALAVNLIVVNPPLAFGVLATIGQSAHSIALSIARSTQNQYRQLKGVEESDGADDEEDESGPSTQP